MEVNKKGKVNFPGDVEIGNNTVIQGDLEVKGKIVGLEIPEPKLPEQKPIEQIENMMKGILHLGDPEHEGCWRLRVEEGSLCFEKREGDEWMIKQSIM